MPGQRATCARRRRCGGTREPNAGETIALIASRIDDAVGRAARTIRKKRGTPDERLLRKAKRKRRGWRRHLQTYLGVNLGLIILDTVLWLSMKGPFPPWPFIVAASWGVALTVHGTHYLGWRRDHVEELEAAKTRLRLTAELGPGSGTLDLAGKSAAEVEAAVREARWGPTWRALYQRCSTAVEGAERAGLSGTSEAAVPGPADLGVSAHKDAQAALRAGLDDVCRLAEGASRIQRVLTELAPGGAIELDRMAAELDQRVASSDDARLRRVFETNRGLLIARKAKVAALEDEMARMRATGEGFALAAENARLDAARLGAGPTPELGSGLAAPLAALSEAVELSRQVEEELETLLV